MAMGKTDSMIRHFDNVKLTDTAPEVAFDECMAQVGVKAGLRLLLVDAPLLTDKAFWPYVQKETKAFIASAEQTKRLYA